jgi:hypothetical protein
MRSLANVADVERGAAVSDVPPLTAGEFVIRAEHLRRRNRYS